VTKFKSAAPPVPLLGAAFHADVGKVAIAGLDRLLLTKQLLSIRHVLNYSSTQYYFTGRLLPVEY